jgi:hypothetical protein
MVLPQQGSELVWRQRLAMRFQIGYLLSLTEQTQKGWSDKPDKRNNYCMTPETDYLLITVLTICTGRLFTAATLHK